ncbi:MULTISPECIES: hypothetical protein [Enterobacteriaceae]|uniref:hypothetical protein n=1 Tax=Enterobacteriaceae TaxID=543 RepID=UPI000DA1E200|nr:MULTISPECIES: hypothetical protein [Enterobacteriaceae]EGT4399185.1 hypothetical protein [Cronobacter malonaticus]EKW6616550.1 hypothetical protein [Pluralibacter gergoviae]EGT4415270.1 hypothetical protein [Cronobacter malonaticus]EKF1803152.1 hypothetical protein [Cronobacter sakazakii]EKY2075034.1 hypothetical protein [Cronobacter sakazakii]
MSKTRFSKPVFSVKSMLTIILITASSTSYAAESIDQLATRIGMDHFREAIKKGDRNAFKTLPAKGYKSGFSGLLIKTNTYISPDDSFAECDTDTVFVSVKERKTIPGCRISLKLASKDAYGSYHDSGIRVEYGIATDSKKFIANNSMWAQHAISGDKVLEGALHPDRTNNHKDQMCMDMAQFTANVTKGRNGGMTKADYYQRLDNMNGKSEVTPQMITLYKTFVDYVYEHPKQDAQVSAAFIYTNCMNKL